MRAEGDPPATNCCLSCVARIFLCITSTAKSMGCWSGCFNGYCCCPPDTPVTNTHDSGHQSSPGTPPSRSAFSTHEAYINAMNRYVIQERQRVSFLEFCRNCGKSQMIVNFVWILQNLGEMSEIFSENLQNLLKIGMLAGCL